MTLEEAPVPGTSQGPDPHDATGWRRAGCLQVLGVFADGHGCPRTGVSLSADHHPEAP